jgi:formate hydrogenlyase transcriptional activator
MADLMVHHRSLPELFHELAQRLQIVVDFQLLNFSLYDPERNAMDMHLWEGELAPEIRCDHSLQESASGWVWEHQQPLLFEDLVQESHPRGRAPDRGHQSRPGYPGGTR